MAANMGAQDGLIEHYKNLSSLQEVDFNEWTSLFSGKEEEDLLNPFSPGESDYYKLDPDWIPLSDLDELMRKNGKTVYATSMAFWFHKYDFNFFSRYRPKHMWKDAVRRVYIQADFKKIGLTPEDWLGLIKERGWFTPESLSSLIVHREVFWGGKTKNLRERALDAWVKFKEYQETKKKESLLKSLDKKLNTFEPSNRLKSLKDLPKGNYEENKE